MQSLRRAYIHISNITQAVSLLPSEGILMYRLRLNMSGGSETKVTIFGDYILHIRDSRRRLEWDIYNSHGHFVNQGDSAIIVGSGKWTLVMLVYSQMSVMLLGNGMASFSGSRRDNMLRDALFPARHLDIGMAVMDLNHVRAMPATPPCSSANYCQLSGILSALFVFIVYFYIIRWFLKRG